MWPFDRKRKREVAEAEVRDALAEAEVRDAHIRAYEEMLRGGWRDYVFETPSPMATIELMRVGWEAPVTARGVDLPPWTNVAGLYWRPAASLIDITPHPPLLN